VSRRTEQINSLLHQAVQGVIQEGLADPRAQGMATVTSVRVTDDLSEAVVNVSIFPEANESKYMHALEEAANYIRREAAERVSLHRPPKLLFRLDRSLKKQAAVFAALSDIAHETKAGGVSSGPSPLSEPRIPPHPEEPSP
jgi:ribosome-binding factor A